MNDRFHCDVVRQIVTPAACAVRVEIGKCTTCPMIEGIKTGDSPNSTPPDGVRKSGTVPNGGEKMAEKKKCSCGCGKNSIKEGLAWGCYTKKHGVAPYGKNAKKASRKSKEPAGRQAGSSPVSGMKSGDILKRLTEEKENKERELFELDNAIETIKKYAN